MAHEHRLAWGVGGAGVTVGVGVRLGAELCDKEQHQRKKHASSLEFSVQYGQNDCLQECGRHPNSAAVHKKSGKLSNVMYTNYQEPR